MNKNEICLTDENYTFGIRECDVAICIGSMLFDSEIQSYCEQETESYIRAKLNKLNNIQNFGFLKLKKDSPGYITDEKIRLYKNGLYFICFKDAGLRAIYSINADQEVTPEPENLGENQCLESISGIIDYIIRRISALENLPVIPQPYDSSNNKPEIQNFTHKKIKC